MPVNWVGLEGLNPYRVQTTRKGPLGATAAESAQKAAAIHAEKDAERQRRERMREAYRKVTDAPDDAHGKVVAARLMTAPVITVQVGERISVARSIVRRERYRHIPVVYEDRTLAGLLRDTDLIAWRPGKASKNSITRVDELMSTRLLSATIDTPLRTVATVMIVENLRCIPIVNSTQRLVGILTARDILRWLVQHSRSLDVRA